jgi:hypothetical protein
LSKSTVFESELFKKPTLQKAHFPNADFSKSTGFKNALLKNAFSNYYFTIARPPFIGIRQTGAGLLSNSFRLIINKEFC